MRAITIRQPWASAIAAGHKAVENRGRNVSYRGEIAIHAGVNRDRWGDRDPRIEQVFGRDPDLPLGCVVAVARLVDCHEADAVRAYVNCCSPWGDRDYVARGADVRNPIRRAWHLVLVDARRLAEPVPARGSLAIPWTLPDDAADAVHVQITGAGAA